MSALDNLFDPSPETKKVQISTSVTEAQRDLIDNLCSAHGISRSKFMEASILDGVAKLKERPIPEKTDDGGEGGE